MSAAVVASVAAVVYWHHICFRSVDAPALRPHKAGSVWRSGSGSSSSTAEACSSSLRAWSRTKAAAFSTVAACWSADTQLLGDCAARKVTASRNYMVRKGGFGGITGAENDNSLKRSYKTPAPWYELTANLTILIQIMTFPKKYNVFIFPCQSGGLTFST